MSKVLDDIIYAISNNCEELINELESCRLTKASAKRSRKLTNILTKQMKEFRKESVEYHKN